MILSHDLIGFAIAEPSFTSELDIPQWEPLDIDLIPGVAEAHTIEQMDECLMAYFNRLIR